MTPPAEASRLIGIASFLWAHMRQASDSPLDLKVIICLLERETIRYAVEQGVRPNEYIGLTKQAAIRATELSKSVMPTPGVVSNGEA